MTSRQFDRANDLRRIIRLSDRDLNMNLRILDSAIARNDAAAVFRYSASARTECLNNSRQRMKLCELLKSTL